MKRRTWQDLAGVVHLEANIYLRSTDGWYVFMLCGAKTLSDSPYRYMERNVNCMTCLVKAPHSQE